jgi:hypothetical protein
MRRRRTSVLALALASLTTVLALAACSGGPEQPILNQFFTASRLRDNTTLANFTTVSFEPGVQGTVTSFDIQSVTPEQLKPLNIKSLAAAQAEAKAADAEYTKRKDAYESQNIDAIKRVLAAENQRTPIKGKDAEVEAAWTKFRSEGAQISKRVFDAKKKLASETSIASISVDDPRNPVDLTKYDCQLASKDVTISAPVRMPDGQTSRKTLIVTMQRAVLTGEKPITGRWIITGIRDASLSGATPHS